MNSPMTFEAGKDYRSEMYGGTFRCLRHWWEGKLELVELAQILPDGTLAPSFERTARAMQPGFNVRHAAGGVQRPDDCPHSYDYISGEEPYCDLCGEGIPYRPNVKLTDSDQRQ